MGQPTAQDKKQEEGVLSLSWLFLPPLSALALEHGIVSMRSLVGIGYPVKLRVMVSYHTANFLSLMDKFISSLQLYTHSP